MDFKGFRAMAYTTFPNETVLLQSDGCTLVETDAQHRPGRQYVAVTADGFRTDYPHWDGVDRVRWDNPEWFPVTFREKASRIIYDAREAYQQHNDKAWAAKNAPVQNAQAAPKQSAKKAAYHYKYKGASITETAALDIQEKMAADGVEDSGDDASYPQGPYAGDVTAPRGNINPSIYHMFENPGNGYCKHCGFEENHPSTNHAKNEGVKSASARSKRAAKFNFGDRVRCTFGDLYSGVREGDEGVVDVVAGIKGKSVHPDPFKKLLMVKWDNGQLASVPVGKVEVIRKGKGPNKVKPVKLFQGDTLVGEFETTDQAYAAAPQPWRKAYAEGYRITQMTHAEEEAARYKHEASDKKTATQLDDFTTAYIEAALWSENDESTPSGGEPLDQNYGIEDIAPETLQRMITDCQKFQQENAAVIQPENLVRQSQYGVDGAAGHDFWLTRNGHGAGFWETSDWKEPASTELDKAAKAFGTYDLYVEDDGKIYGV